MNNFNASIIDDLIHHLEFIKSMYGNLSLATYSINKKVDVENGIFGTVQYVHAYNQKEPYLIIE